VPPPDLCGNGGEAKTLGSPKNDKAPPSKTLGGAEVALERETGFEPATLSLGM
jgi:hypothetical protein